MYTLISDLLITDYTFVDLDIWVWICSQFRNDVELNIVESDRIHSYEYISNVLMYNQTANNSLIIRLLKIIL